MSTSTVATLTYDRVIRDDLAQATTTTDLWMREKRAAYNHYAITEDADKVFIMYQAAQLRSADADDWEASYDKFFANLPLTLAYGAWKESLAWDDEGVWG
jgi:hypothetical protein